MSDTTRVISISGLNVEAGNGYVAGLHQSYVQPEMSIFRAERDGDAPIVTQVAPGLYMAMMWVVVDESGNPTPDEVNARRGALMRTLDTTRGPLTLTIENATGTARRRWMNFVARKIDQLENMYGRGFMVTLESAADVRWRATTTEEVTWTFSSSGTQTLTNIGDLEAWPEITIRPTGEKTGGNWVYSRRFLVKWKSPLAGAHILDVTGGGLDTAALLAADKINSAANVGIHLNGRYAPFWFGNSDGQPGGFNSTTTRIFVTLDVPRPITPMLATYISETATEWRVRDDGGLPSSGVLDVEGEYIYYNSRAPGVLYGVRRGLYGTTPYAHIAGTETEVMAAVGYILYGPAAAVPASARTAAYNAAQPPILANGSTNGEWVYEQFAGTKRPGSWELDTGPFGQGPIFFSESFGNGYFNPAPPWPWDAMGLQIGWASKVEFTNRFAIPIKEVLIGGRHWAKGSPAQYPNSVRLYALDDQKANSRQLWSASAGVSRTVNTTFSTTPALPTDADSPLYNRLAWGFAQSNYVQADMQTMTVRFRDEYLPEIVLGAEDTPYDLDLQITNGATGEWFQVTYPNAVPGEGLIIDAEQQTVRDEATGYNQFGAVTSGWTQERFLTLLPGGNAIAVTEDVMGTVEVTFRYAPRWYT